MELKKKELTVRILTVTSFDRLDKQPEELSEGELININEERGYDKKYVDTPKCYRQKLHIGETLGDILQN